MRKDGFGCASATQESQVGTAMNTNIAERSVIASVIIQSFDEQRIVDVSSLGLTPEHFRSEQHQDLWRAILGCIANGKPPDPIQIMEWRYQNVGKDAAGEKLAEQILDIIESEIDVDTENCAAAIVARGRM